MEETEGGIVSMNIRGGGGYIKVLGGNSVVVLGIFDWVGQIRNVQYFPWVGTG
jgi:hypothetical protein